jgi:hypothetical protein
VRDSAIELIAVAGTAALYRFKHHNSIRNHVGAVAILDTLTVNKGTERYRVEPGKDYLLVSETARWARVAWRRKRRARHCPPDPFSA